MDSPGLDRSAENRRWPRAAAVLAVLAFVALLAYGLVASGTSTAIDESLARGEAEAAPAFELPVLDRGELSPKLERRLQGGLADGRLGLEELAATPVVLNFWASWCTPCREEAPLLESAWGRYSKRGVLFLGLDMQDFSEDARAFLREFSVTYPTIREPGNEVARSYGATGVPETFFIDVNGRVVGHVTGLLTREQLAIGIAAARSGQVAGALDGGAVRPQR